MGCSLYEGLLGPAFNVLHAHVRCAHLPPLRAEGTMNVEHGQGWLTRPMIWLMQLPGAGAAQPVSLDVAQDGSELVWTRRIGGSTLRTRQRASGSRLEERVGVARISFDLVVQNAALVYKQSSIHVAGLPLPSSLSPHVGAVVSATTDGWSVEVTVQWRRQIVCRYSGAIRAS